MTNKEDKRTEALKLLNDIKKISHVVELLQEQINEAYSALTNVTVKPKKVNVQTSPPKDLMADQVTEVVEYQKELEGHQAELIKKKKLALSVIKKMTIDNQRLLLLKYFRGYTVGEVSDYIGFSTRQTDRLLKEAKEEFVELYKIYKDGV